MKTQRFSLHQYGLGYDLALQGKFRGYKQPGTKLRPRYVADYAMTGAKNAHELRRFNGESGFPSRQYAAPQRFQKIAMKFYGDPAKKMSEFSKLPRPARRILNEVWAAEAYHAEEKAYGHW